MISPRCLRPHTVTVWNYVGEDSNGIAKYQLLYVEYVRLNENYGVIQSQKGIKNSDDAMLVVDVNDLIAYNDQNNKVTYLNQKEFDELENQTPFFTFKKGKDFVSPGKCTESEKGYTVNTVKEIHALSTRIEYLEIGLRNG